MKSSATAERQMSPLSVYLPIVVPILIALAVNLPRAFGAFSLGWLSEPLLNQLTLLSYLACSVLLIGYVFTRDDGFLKFTSALVVVGFTFHTTSFILRWVDVGRPPYGGINEVVMSFAWALVLINLVVVYSARFRQMNLVSMPLATIAVLLATIFPTERTGFLVPALNTYWLYIHVSMAMLAYPTFAISFVIALLYLIKDRVRPESFGIYITAITFLVYLFLDQFSLITSATYHLTGFADGRPIMVAPEVPLRVPMPGVGPVFLSVLSLSLLAFIFYVLSGKRPQYGRRAWRLVLVSLPLQIIGLLVLIYHITRTPTVSFSSSPFELTGMAIALLSTLFLCVLTAKQEAIIQILPEREKLDWLVYRTITFGLPLLSLQIITGAIWAGEAWGRYWGWDPKEVWALITALVYVAYLHVRMTRNWTGRRSVYFSIVGFACVLFTYLGVTYLLSGLHSYK